jgi:divalent metal cation (Fe/Co/Zn/Cd) transporter
MNEKNQLFRKGERAAVISAAILLAFSLLKGTVSVISGSVALLADSIHSFAVIFSSIARALNEKFPEIRAYYKSEPRFHIPSEWGLREK